MAELWQSYGSWVLYGLFFVAMMLMHGRMHGHSGHAHGLSDDEPRASAKVAGEHAHGETGKSSGHRRGGCC